jgi:hypothetical protein
VSLQTAKAIKKLAGDIGIKRTYVDSIKLPTPYGGDENACAGEVLPDCKSGKSSGSAKSACPATRGARNRSRKVFPRGGES